MGVLAQMQAIEAEGFRSQGESPERAKQKALPRVWMLFAAVVMGILFSWFWGIGWAYLADTSKPINTGPMLAFGVRVGLSIGAALLTFQRTYEAVGKGTATSSLPYLIAFQNGFFWEALLGTVVAQFTGTGSTPEGGTPTPSANP
jgi:hypothetical protein